MVVATVCDLWVYSALAPSRADRNMCHSLRGLEQSVIISRVCRARPSPTQPHPTRRGRALAHQHHRPTHRSVCPRSPASSSIHTTLCAASLAHPTACVRWRRGIIIWVSPAKRMTRR